MGKFYHSNSSDMYLVDLGGGNNAEEEQARGLPPKKTKKSPLTIEMSFRMVPNLRRPREVERVVGITPWRHFSYKSVYSISNSSLFFLGMHPTPQAWITLTYHDVLLD